MAMSKDQSDGVTSNQYEFALLLFSQGHGHWAITINQQGDERGIIHHARTDPKRSDDVFHYERLEDKVLPALSYGRSTLAVMTARDSQRVDAVLGSIGRDEDNIPVYTQGQDCTTFVIKALERIEKEGHLPNGCTGYFRTMQGQTGKAIRDTLEVDGRHWQQSAPRRQVAGRPNDPGAAVYVSKPAIMKMPETI